MPHTSSLHLSHWALGPTHSDPALVWPNLQKLLAPLGHPEYLLVIKETVTFLCALPPPPPLAPPPPPPPLDLQSLLEMKFNRQKQDLSRCL